MKDVCDKKWDCPDKSDESKLNHRELTDKAKSEIAERHDQVQALISVVYVKTNQNKYFNCKFVCLRTNQYVSLDSVFIKEEKRLKEMFAKMCLLRFGDRYIENIVVLGELL